MRAGAVSVAVGVIGRSGAIGLGFGFGCHQPPGCPRGPTTTTPAEVATRSALPFCGVEQGAGPGITINAEVRSCFVGGYRDGTGAEFASIQTSMEGDPIATIYRTVPGGGIEMLVDSTQDRFGEKGGRRTTCRVLLNDPREVFVRTAATRASPSRSDQPAPRSS